MQFSVNHPILFVIVAVIVGAVLAQSAYFLIKSYRRAKTLGMDMKKVNKTIVSSAVFTIAPAVSIVITILALSKSLGFALPRRRQRAVFSLPCLGVNPWLRAMRLLRLENLAPHSRHARPVGLPRLRPRRMRPSARTCLAPSPWRIMRAGPSRQKYPQPTAQAWFAAYRMRLGLWANCQRAFTSPRCRRVAA